MAIYYIHTTAKLQTNSPCMNGSIQASSVHIRNPLSKNECAIFPQVRQYPLLFLSFIHDQNIVQSKTPSELVIFLGSSNIHFCNTSRFQKRFVIGGSTQKLSEMVSDVMCSTWCQNHLSIVHTNR